MLADASRYQQLQLAKEEEKRHFEQAVEDIRAEHETKIFGLKEQHRKEMEFRQTQIAQLNDDIYRTKQKNQETLDSIQRDTTYEKEDIEKKNTHNQLQVNDMKLKATAECQLANNKL